MDSVGGAALVIACITAALAILKWFADRPIRKQVKELLTRVDSLEAKDRVQLDYIENLRYWGATAPEPPPRIPPPYPPTMRTIFVPQTSTD